MNYIRNFAVLVTLIIPVCAAPRKKVASKPTSTGVLVFQRGKRLEAIRLGQKAPVVLRDSFLFNINYREVGTD